jgi:hypothetical protein
VTKFLKSQLFTEGVGSAGKPHSQPFVSLEQETNDLTLQQAQLRAQPSLTIKRPTKSHRGPHGSKGNDRWNPKFFEHTQHTTQNDDTGCTIRVVCAQSTRRMSSQQKQLQMAWKVHLSLGLNAPRQLLRRHLRLLHHEVHEVPSVQRAGLPKTNHQQQPLQPKRTPTTVS